MASCLPFPVLDRIFDHLSPKDIDICMQVNNYWFDAGLAYLESRRRRLVQCLIHCRGLQWKVLEPLQTDFDSPSRTILPTMTPFRRSSSSSTTSFLNLPAPSVRCPGPRKNANFLHIQHYLYVFGGSTDNHTAYNDVWRFSLQSHLWERVATSGNPPSPRSNSCCIIYGRHIVIFGGKLWLNNVQNENVLFLLDTETHQWSQARLNCSDSDIKLNDEDVPLKHSFSERLRISVEHGIVRDSNLEGFIFFSNVVPAITEPLEQISIYLSKILYTKAWHSTWLLDICQRMGKSICVLKSKWLVIYGGLTRLAVQNRLQPKSEEAARQHSGIGLVDLSNGMFFYRQTKGPSIPIRMNHCAVTVGDDRMLVFGGQYVDGSPCTDYWILSCTENVISGHLDWEWIPVNCKNDRNSCRDDVHCQHWPGMVSAGQMVELPNDPNEPRNFIVCLCAENETIHSARLEKFRRQQQQKGCPTLSPTSFHNTDGASLKVEEKSVAILLPSNLLSLMNSPVPKQRRQLKSLIVWPSYEVGLCVYLLNIAGVYQRDLPLTCEWVCRSPSESIVIPRYWKHPLLASNANGDRIYMLSAPIFSPNSANHDETNRHEMENFAFERPFHQMRIIEPSATPEDHLYVCTLTLKNK